MTILEKGKLHYKWAKVSQRERAERLEKVSKVLEALSPEAHAVIRRNGIKVHYDSSLIGSRFGGYYRTRPDTTDEIIRHPELGPVRVSRGTGSLAEFIAFNPLLTLPQAGVTALHEGCHAWQSACLGFTGEGANRKRSSYGLRAALILSRMMEGGAFAYQGGLRGFFAEEGMEDASVLRRKHAIADDPQGMGERFLNAQKALPLRFSGDLDDYDRNTLEAYYKHRFHAGWEPQAPEEKMAIGEMRRILHVRPTTFSPAYLTQMSDGELENAIVKPIPLPVIKAVGLIEEFEAARDSCRFMPHKPGGRALRREALREVKESVRLALAPRW